MRLISCAECRFYLDAPAHPHLQRCLHPHARILRRAEGAPLCQWQTPEARNAHGDCPDFTPWPWWDRPWVRVLAVWLVLLQALGVLYMLWLALHA